MHAFDHRDLEQYKAEVKEKWGSTDAYREHAEKTKNYSKDKWSRLTGEMNEIFAAFAACRRDGHSPDSTEVQALVAQLQRHITAHYYHCTDEILAGLGQMYTADERFRQNIDRHADGTAAYVRDAIGICCGQR